MRERRRRPLQDLADLQERLALPAAAVEELIGKVLFRCWSSRSRPAAPAAPTQTLLIPAPPMASPRQTSLFQPQDGVPIDALGSDPAPWLELSSEQLISLAAAGGGPSAGGGPRNLTTTGQPVESAG